MFKQFTIALATSCLLVSQQTNAFFPRHPSITEVQLHDGSWTTEEQVQKTLNAINSLPEDIRLPLFDSLYVACRGSKKLDPMFMFKFRNDNLGGADHAIDAAKEAGLCDEQGVIKEKYVPIILNAMRSSEAERNVGNIIIVDPRASQMERQRHGEARRATAGNRDQQPRSNRSRGCCVLQ